MDDHCAFCGKASGREDTLYDFAEPLDEFRRGVLDIEEAKKAFGLHPAKNYHVLRGCYAPEVVSGKTVILGQGVDRPRDMQKADLRGK